MDAQGAAGVSQLIVCRSEKRIRTSLERLVKMRQTSAQGRLDGFFKVVESSSSSSSTLKRPVMHHSDTLMTDHV